LAMATHNERGIALVLALFLMTALSVLGASLMFLAQTETYASMNYRIMSQTRYAAEAGVNKVANFLLDGAQYAVPTAAPGVDPIGGDGRNAKSIGERDGRVCDRQRMRCAPAVRQHGNRQLRFIPRYLCRHEGRHVGRRCWHEREHPRLGQRRHQRPLVYAAAER